MCAAVVTVVVVASFFLHSPLPPPLNGMCALSHSFHPPSHPSLCRCCASRCCSIQALMSAPNPDDPLDEGIAKHWKTNEVDALAVARQWTLQWAQSD